MRKKIIIISILILITSIVVFLFIKPDKKKDECFIDYDKTLNDINDFYMNQFNPIDLSFEKPIILTNIVNVENVLYAVNTTDENEYFVIMKDISEHDIEMLKEEVSIQKNLSNKYFNKAEVITKSNYTYLVVSLDKTSIIRGIISSNIYCEK